MTEKSEKNGFLSKILSVFSKKHKSGAESAPVERIETDPGAGLTAAQVEERVAAGLTNVSSDKGTKSVWQIISSNIFTYFNMIFIVIAVILIIEKSYNNLTFLIVITINTVIGIVQEIRAKKTLEKLTLVSAPMSVAVRDGEEVEIVSEQLVVDDIIVLSSGNQIVADGVVCDGEISVNEALVTGESDEIRKKAGDAVLSGSFVVSGSCRARLDKVGEDSFVSKLSADAKKIKKKQQPGMMKSLNLLIKIIGIIIIPLAAALFLNSHIRLGHDVKTSVETTAGSVIGLIPEGLYLLTSIALAVSVMRLAKKQTLVHDMKCIETLARVDTICVDKTGTVTEPEMHLESVVPLYPAMVNEEGLSEIVRQLVMNMSSENFTMAALKEHFDNKRGYRQAKFVKAFSSATKYSAVSYDGVSAVLIGAPEFILRSDYEGYRHVVEEHSSKGERVLLVAEYRDNGDVSGIFGGGDLYGTVSPIGLVTLKNRVRPEARQTFEYFTEQGVAIKVISGDNPLTASRAAEEAGIPNADKYIDASLLVTSEKIAKAVNDYTVFGRVTPDQKREFVKALKKSGHTVAMTGDGVNDVLALKDADCSIAMASGSDAAASVSDLVLLDSDFSNMPLVVAEGRRVINNIERSASLFLSKNVFTLIFALISLISQSLYPFKPAQLSLVSALMIGFPSFVLALEPNTNLVKGKFLRNVLFRAFPTAITAAIMVYWSMMFSNAFFLKTGVSSTLAFYVYSIVAYIMLFRVCKPMNIIHMTLFGGMGAAFILAAALIPNLFELSALNWNAWLVLVTLAYITVPLSKIIYDLFNNFGGWKERFIDFIKRDVEKHRNESGDQ